MMSGLAERLLCAPEPMDISERSVPRSSINRRWRVGLWVVCSLIGLIHVLPDLVFVRVSQRRLSGVHLVGAPDELYYLGRISAAMRGDPRLANVAIAEHRQDPYLMPPIPEVVTAWLGRLFGLSIISVDMLCTFLYPALACLACYLWLGFLTPSPAARLVAACALTLGLSWLSPSLQGLRAVWEAGAPLLLTRPISPVWHLLCLFLALALIFRALSVRTFFSVLAAGAAAGLAWYTSMYFSTFLAMLLFLLLAGALVSRNGSHLKVLVGVVACVGLVAIPSLINWRQARLAEGFPDLWERYGAVMTHQPILSVIPLGVSAFVLWGLRRQPPRIRWWMGACLLAGWLSLNQHVVTGWTVQPFHWQTLLIKPMLIAGVILTVAWQAVRWPLVWRRTLTGTFVAVLIGVSAAIQARYYQVMSRWADERLALGPICRWLTTTAAPDDVVLVNPMVFDHAEYVSTYSGNPVYLSDPFFIVSLLPREEIEHRYLAALHFYGYTQEEAQRLFDMAGGAGLFVGMRALDWARDDLKRQRRYIQYLRERYEQVARKDPLSALAPYRVTYALLSADDIHRLAERQAAVLKRLSAVYEAQGLIVCRIEERPETIGLARLERKS